MSRVKQKSCPQLVQLIVDAYLIAHQARGCYEVGEIIRNFGGKGRVEKIRRLADRALETTDEALRLMEEDPIQAKKLLRASLAMSTQARQLYGEAYASLGGEWRVQKRRFLRASSRRASGSR